MTDVIKDDSFRYTVISGSPSCDSHDVRLYDDVYSFWSKLWHRTFSENQTNLTPNPDQFWRQNLIHVVTFNEKVVSLLCCTFFNSKYAGVRQHSYFKYYPVKIMTEQIAKNTIMTQEYLSVDPDFRKKTIGFSLGAVVIGLTLKTFERSNIDICINIARADRGVTQTLGEYGYKVSEESMSIHNTPCNVCFVHREQHPFNHPDEHISRIVNKLWASRTVLTSQHLSMFREEKPKSTISENSQIIAI